MVRVLIPFTDAEGAERAVRRVLDEPGRSPLEVELLAIVEPLVPGKVPLYLTRRRADSLARAAAQSWIEGAAAQLRARGVPCRGFVALGRARELIDAAAHRDDVDRVLLPAPRRFPVMGRRFRLARAPHRAVTIVR